MSQSRFSSLTLHVMMIFCWFLTNSEVVLLPRAFAAPGDFKEVIEKHPEWKPILENPQKEIEQLIKKRRFGVLADMVSVVHHKDFIVPLCDQLGEVAPHLGTRHVMEAMINTRHPEVLSTLVLHTFSQPDMEPVQDLMRRTIKVAAERGDRNTLLAFTARVVSQPYSPPFKDVIMDLIETRDPQVLSKLASDTFSRPHTRAWEEALGVFIENADERILTYIDRFALTKTHWDIPKYSYLKKAVKVPDLEERRALLRKGRKTAAGIRPVGTKPILENPYDQIEKLLQNQDFEKLEVMMREIHDEDFVIPLCTRLGSALEQKPVDFRIRRLIQVLVEKRDPDALHALVQYTFSQPGTASIQDFMKRALVVAQELGDDTTSYLFLGSVFGKPNSTELEGVLIDLIQTANRDILKSFAESTLSWPHAVKWKKALKVFIDRADSQLLDLMDDKLYLYQRNEPEYAELKRALNTKRTAQFNGEQRTNCLLPNLKKLILSSGGAAND